MAEGRRRTWWHSVPGMLTAGAAFLAALTGLLTGLKELGLFLRPEPVPAPQAAASLDTVVPRSGVSKSLDSQAVPSDSAPAPAPVEAPQAETRARPLAPARPSPPAAADNTAAASPDTTAPPAGAAPSIVLPSGTVLQLAASSRICSTTAPDGARLTAVLVVPVTLGDSVALPAGTIAVLRVRRLPDPTFMRLRLDSLLTSSVAVPVARSDIRARLTPVSAGEDRAEAGACVSRGGRITATLREALRLGRL